MKSFPMFLRTTGRRVVIVGGGEQAAQKARLILKTDAEITLVAPELDEELKALVVSGRATLHSGAIDPEVFRGTALTFVATGCPGIDAAVHDLAKAGGAVVNVVDQPDLCDAVTPSIVDRDPVVVAIGTEGTAPVLGRAIKTQIETMLPPRIGALAALAGRLRGAVTQSIPRSSRKAFWAWVFKGEPAQMHNRGSEAHAAAMLKDAIRERRVPGVAGQGMISLVGAGPGARDLLTMRAVERLQEADVIFYDRLVDTGVLELARRDAERVFVGKEVGACAWPQEKISALIVAEARRGRRVVRLKSGDPSVFGRANEEILAAKAADVPVEIVPGITAASAAASSLGTGLTERGLTDTIVIVTGACRPGDPAPDWGQHVRPGVTMAIYMGVRTAGDIAAGLIAAGAPSDSGVDIAVEVSTERERLLRAPLGELETCLKNARVTGAALLIVRLPKQQATVVQQPVERLSSPVLKLAVPR